jgi:hypothetical protein
MLVLDWSKPGANVDENGTQLTFADGIAKCADFRVVLNGDEIITWLEALNNNANKVDDASKLCTAMTGLGDPTSIGE